MVDELERDIEEQVERLGFELVEVERAGARTRPVLRLRIDRPDSVPGHGVTLDDCTRVSRSLEAFLEERGEVPARYVLEVSSPGVERPLVRPRDFERFRGQRVAAVARDRFQHGGKRVEGELLGRDEETGHVRLRTDEAEELSIRSEEIKRINLVYQWGGGGNDTLSAPTLKGERKR